MPYNFAADSFHT